MRALQRVWYAKLKASGFEDIEGGGKYPLKSLPWGIRPEVYDETAFVARQDYYRRASQFFHSHDFAWIPNASLVNLKDREIWKWHAEGWGIRQISEKLSSLGFSCCNKDYVNQIIQKIREKMHDGFTED